MDIGYIILSHRDWPQVANLVSRIIDLDKSATIVVSHDSADAEGVQALKKIPGITVQTAPGGRGDFSGIERWHDAVTELRKQGTVDYVLLLSGQDYLTAHPDRIRTELKSSGDGYLEYFAVLDPAATPWGTAEGRTRYYFSWRDLRPVTPKTARRLRFLHGLNRVQPWMRINVAYGALRVGRRASGPPEPYVVYGGSQWNALSWRAVERVSSVLHERADIVNWARRSLVSDECFFQTVLLNDETLQFSQGSKRYYDFSGAIFGHPKLLGMEHLEPIKSSGAWFARKVDWESSRSLIRSIDSEVLQVQ